MKKMNVVNKTQDNWFMLTEETLRSFLTEGIGKIISFWKCEVSVPGLPCEIE